ncbi:MAG: hypothetical protein HXS53_13110 [Theionarchaea archaeon]|nr:hypothetical protein [Theionarchaea archaeon]
MDNSCMMCTITGMLKGFRLIMMILIQQVGRRKEYPAGNQEDAKNRIDSEKKTMIQ